MAARAASASAGLGTRPRGGPVSDYAAGVLDIVERIPRGTVMTYADVAEMHGRGSARGVGKVMFDHGSETHWWRVVQASGQPAAPLVEEALELLRRDRCPLRGGRVDLARARWDGR